MLRKSNLFCVKPVNNTTIFTFTTAYCTMVSTEPQPRDQGPGLGRGSLATRAILFFPITNQFKCFLGNLLGLD